MFCMQSDNQKEMLHVPQFLHCLTLIILRYPNLVNGMKNESSSYPFPSFFIPDLREQTVGEGVQGCLGSLPWAGHYHYHIGEGGRCRWASCEALLMTTALVWLFWVSRHMDPFSRIFSSNEAIFRLGFDRHSKCIFIWHYWCTNDHFRLDRREGISEGGERARVFRVRRIATKNIPTNSPQDCK